LLWGSIVSVSDSQPYSLLKLEGGVRSLEMSICGA
jgi:hypothetical protein